MNEEKLSFSNYCVSFIDLLGQSDAMKGEGLLPDFKSGASYDDFIERATESVGAIDALQSQASAFRSKIGPPKIIKGISAEDQKLVEEMGKMRAKQQRWSDGLVFFSPLDQGEYKCPMNAVFEMFLMSGVLCFMGLSLGKPVRGAIETAWGVELHENEIYGPAVARAYELESKVAQYPRIVIGDITYSYLQSYMKENPNVEDKLSLYNRNLAATCISMTAVDNDGYRVIDYLGKTFTKSVTGDGSKELYRDAYEFIVNQYEEHKDNRNSKLSLRYTWLRGYFRQHRDDHA